jgi:hypothetical protein
MSIIDREKPIMEMLKIELECFRETYAGCMIEAEAKGVDWAHAEMTTLPPS